MKKEIILILISTLLYAVSFAGKNLAAQNSRTDDEDYIQHTTWGFATGANLLNYSLNLEYAVDAPDKTKPGIGAELGFFLDYHISDSWALRFAPSTGIEHINLYKGEDDGHLITFAAEFAISMEYTFKIQNSEFNINLGPYTHFVIASTLYGSDNLVNPYSRTIASDPITEKPNFAIGDLNSGLALSLAYQLPSLWFLQLDLKYGVTDLLNADSHRLYFRPFKAVISLGHRFM